MICEYAVSKMKHSMVMLFLVIAVAATASAQKPTETPDHVPPVQGKATSQGSLVMRSESAPSGACDLGKLVTVLVDHMEQDHPEVITKPTPDPGALTFLSNSTAWAATAQSGWDGCYTKIFYIDSAAPQPTIAERRKLAECYERTADAEERKQAEKERAAAARLEKLKTLWAIAKSCSPG